MRKIKNVLLSIIAFLIVTVIISLITGVIIMFLWNWLMPEIFGIPTITYLQGVGLSSLCSMLFKSTNLSKKV